jgi:hypothetical protein
LAVSGETLVVGATNEDGAGAAYIFVRSGMTWSQQAYLKASNADGGDLFGNSVAISGDTVVVGAYAENGGATGVNGDDADNSALDSGAAYVFIRDGGGLWMQQAYLKASNTGASDKFGVSVALSSDYFAVIGADLEDSGATGVDGDQDNNLAGNAGAAYVFTLPPDCDGDGDVDLDDYADYTTCHDVPGAGLGIGCECFDWNVDGDVDLRDFAPIQHAIGQ